MKKVLLFLFTALSFCLMTGCGERKMSEEEIQRKIDALYEKVVEAEKNNDSAMIMRYLLEALKLREQLALSNPYRETIYFVANQRMGITKYLLREYAETVTFLEKALSADVEERESILNHKLDIYIMLMLSYDKIGNIKKRDNYLQLAEQQVRTLEEEIGDSNAEDFILERLAAYYEENGYHAVQHKRSARYEILLNYVRTYHKEQADRFREVLTYDYYLRENAKSRPEFAGEYLVTKDVARAFYENEEETHKYLPDYGKYDRNQMRKMTHLEYFKLADAYYSITRTGIR